MQMKIILFVTLSIFAELIYGNGEFREYRGDKYAKEAVTEAMQKVQRAMNRASRKWDKEEVWKDPWQLFHYFKKPPTEASVKRARASDIFELTLTLVQDKLKEKSPRSKRRVNATDVLSPDTLKALAKFSGCRVGAPDNECPDDCISNKYRTITGECNNKEHPYWGAANEAHSRWLPSQYENGFSSPIGWTPGLKYNGFTLPNVRDVSNVIMKLSNSDARASFEDPDFSHLHVVWGQYLTHDMDLTPQSWATSTFQGLTNCNTGCAKSPPCFPIEIPANDERISTSKCLPFLRSAAVCGTGETSAFFDTLAPRQQMSAVTTTHDASTVYGSSERLAGSLRDFSNEFGLMKVNDRHRDISGNREYLPFNFWRRCVQDPESDEKFRCFNGGDARASEHLPLTTMHTLWVREHNRIAKELRVLNPHWSGETLYQEARKVVGAYHQVISWEEYLPKILGPTGMAMVGNYAGYDSSADPTVSNVFATAAFRFGHVTISPDLRRFDENYNEHPEFPSTLLHTSFFSSYKLAKYGGCDPIIRGLIGRPAKLNSPLGMMNDELREKLFALQNKVAFDLASLNLQRGRDHGIPGYNDWREFCGLPRANSFSELSGEITDADLRQKLEELYGHPSNVDIYVAGLSEDSVPGARVGPTFLCLLTRQFKLMRDGDSFHYRNPGVFSADQVSSIQKMRISKLFCDNSGITRAPRDAMSNSVFPQDFIDCRSLPALDLSPWREDMSAAVGACGVPPTVANSFSQKCGNNIISYSCQSGYSLVGSSEVQCVGNTFTSAPTCEDVNECESDDNGGCEDVCENEIGYRVCSCNENRVLQPDGKSCEDEPEEIEEKPEISVKILVFSKEKQRKSISKRHHDGHRHHD